MAHLHKCQCGQTFRCDHTDHTASAWWRCMRRCPNAWVHGEGGLIQTMDAEVLRMFDTAITQAENP